MFNAIKICFMGKNLFLRMWSIVYGRRLFGYCNSVPTVFHVRTVFYHFWFLPLCPIQSYLFFDDNRGLKIPLNSKSMNLAWLRGITLVTAFVSFASILYAFSSEMSSEMSSEICILVFFVSSTLTCFLMLFNYLPTHNLSISNLSLIQ